MKRILSCIVSAIVAVAFAGLVSAADQTTTGTGTTNAAPSATDTTGTMGGTDTGAKPMKKAKKKKAKKTKKAKKHPQEGATTDTATQPAASPSPTGK